MASSNPYYGWVKDLEAAQAVVSIGCWGGKGILRHHCLGSFKIFYPAIIWVWWSHKKDFIWCCYWKMYKNANFTIFWITFFSFDNENIWIYNI
jgi:hypothetical protein